MASRSMVGGAINQMVAPPLPGGAPASGAGFQRGGGHGAASGEALGSPAHEKHQLHRKRSGARLRKGIPGLLVAVPEDLVWYTHMFLSGRDLAAVSAVSRECYFSAFLASAHHFKAHFGAPPPISLRWRLSRVRLFSMVDRVHIATEANHRDLLLWSACRGYTQMISTLCASSSGKIFETKHVSSGATPLILAAEHGQTSVVSLLLSLGADVSRSANNGLNAMHVACKNGRVEIAGMLLDHDETVSDMATPDGRTPLMFAASSGHLAIVKLLIERGAEIDSATRDDNADADVGGDTALHLASYHGYSDIVSHLISCGADANLSMRNGRTPLIIASEQGHAEVAHMLLKSGCNVDSVTNSGKSALYSACENGHTDIVPMLLDFGSDVNQATRRNKIPLYVAAEKGYLEIARILLSRAGAADLFVQTKYGTTPMFIASKTSNQKMKALLLEFCRPAKKKRAAKKKPKKPKGTPGGASGMASGEESDGGVEEHKSSAAADRPSVSLSGGPGSGGALSGSIRHQPTCPAFSKTLPGGGVPRPASCRSPRSPRAAGSKTRPGSSSPRPASRSRSPRRGAVGSACTCGAAEAFVAASRPKSPTSLSHATPEEREAYLVAQRQAAEAAAKRQEEWRARQRQRQRQAALLTAEAPRFAAEFADVDDFGHGLGIGAYDGPGSGLHGSQRDGERYARPWAGDSTVGRAGARAGAGGSGAPAGASGPGGTESADDEQARRREKARMEKMAERARARLREKEAERERERQREEMEAAKKASAEEKRRQAEEARVHKDRRAKQREWKQREEEQRAAIARAAEERRSLAESRKLEAEEEKEREAAKARREERRKARATEARRHRPLATKTVNLGPDGAGSSPTGEEQSPSKVRDASAKAGRMHGSPLRTRAGATSGAEAGAAPSASLPDMRSHDAGGVQGIDETPSPSVPVSGLQSPVARSTVGKDTIINSVGSRGLGRHRLGSSDTENVTGPAGEGELCPPRLSRVGSAGIGSLTAAGTAVSAVRTSARRLSATEDDSSPRSPRGPASSWALYSMSNSSAADGIRTASKTGAEGRPPAAAGVLRRGGSASFVPGSAGNDGPEVAAGSEANGSRPQLHSGGDDSWTKHPTPGRLMINLNKTRPSQSSLEVAALATPIASESAASASGGAAAEATHRPKSKQRKSVSRRRSPRRGTTSAGRQPNAPAQSSATLLTRAPSPLHASNRSGSMGMVDGGGGEASVAHAISGGSASSSRERRKSGSVGAGSHYSARKGGAADPCHPTSGDCSPRTLLERQSAAERDREERMAALKREESEKWEKVLSVFQGPTAATIPDAGGADRALRGSSGVQPRRPFAVARPSSRQNLSASTLAVVSTPSGDFGDGSGDVVHSVQPHPRPPSSQNGARRVRSPRISPRPSSGSNGLHASGASLGPAAVPPGGTAPTAVPEDPRLERRAQSFHDSNRTQAPHRARTLTTAASFGGGDERSSGGTSADWRSAPLRSGPAPFLEATGRSASNPSHSPLGSEPDPPKLRDTSGMGGIALRAHGRSAAAGGVSPRVSSWTSSSSHTPVAHGGISAPRELAIVGSGDPPSSSSAGFHISGSAAASAIAAASGSVSSALEGRHAAQQRQRSAGTGPGMGRLRPTGGLRRGHAFES